MAHIKTRLKFMNDDLYNDMDCSKVKSVIENSLIVTRKRILIRH
jgi:hypothetical protein